MEAEQGELIGDTNADAHALQRKIDEQTFDCHNLNIVSRWQTNIVVHVFHTWAAASELHFLATSQVCHVILIDMPSHRFIPFSTA